MKILIYFFLILLLAACKDQAEVLVKNDSGQVIEKYFTNKDSVKNGEYESFYDNGILKEKAFYKDGKLDGQRILYFKNGQNEIVENYMEGEMHGPYEVYHPNGTVLLKQTFERGTLKGESFKYFDNGQLEEKVVFVNNLENGPFEEYYENGELHWAGNYLNGDNEFGLLSEYDESGQLIKKMQCDSLAVCRTVWTIEEGDISPKY